MKALILLVSVATLANAQARPDSTRMALAGGFAEVAGWMTRSAELVPADKYAYRPVATTRTYGQLVAHVVDGLNWYCASAAGKEAEWSDAVEKGKLDKATVVAALKAAITKCEAQYKGAGRFQPLMANISHTNLHYGNVITYVRMMGMVPPSS
jgi:hypothetical protein